LGQVLSVFGIVASASNKSIQRIPIKLAKISEGRLRTGRLSLSREQNDAPMRGSKAADSIILLALVRYHLSDIPPPNLHGSLLIGNCGFNLVQTPYIRQCGTIRPLKCFEKE
jgi:hypothetical protein